MAEESVSWEYRVQIFGTFWSSVKPEEMEKELNEWGQEGWEVVSSVVVENTNKITVIAKRPLSNKVRRMRSMP
jgi:hypothetical protein